MLVWPSDWQPMTTAQLPAPGTPSISIPAGRDVTVGPFRWTPDVRGHECLLMMVSAEGDRSNGDLATGFPCARGPTPHWRLVPFDNNIAQRNVAPVTGGRSSGLMAEFKNRRFMVANPTDQPIKIQIEVTLPKFLQELGWRAVFPDLKSHKPH